MNTLDTSLNGFQAKFEAFLIGCDALEDLQQWDTDTLGDMDVFYTNDMVSVILRLIARDGNISQKEVTYLDQAFGFDLTVDELTVIYENCYDTVDHAFDESFENGIGYMRKISPPLADAYKELLELACDIIATSDGMVSESERNEILALKALCQ